MAWPALQAARRAEPGARLPLFIGEVRVGSVARAHLPALQAWPQWVRVADAGVVLLPPLPQLGQALHEMNAALRAQGLVRAWRDEVFPVFDPATQEVLAHTERAATRFWGLLTLGAHATGHVRDAAGRVQALWIAQRSFAKATDPGAFDNLVGGGVPAGQSVWDALLREGWEEAGLPPERMAQATPGNVIRLDRAIPEGHQVEDLHAFDLELPEGLSPDNQDGEVHAFQCLPVPEALALAASGRMTVDASLVTLDFAVRHRLLPDTSAPALAGELQRLFAPGGRRDQKT